MSVVSDLTSELTIDAAQRRQPWIVPYSTAVEEAEINGVSHIYATHATLHAAKSVGKLAAVFENLDHIGGPPSDSEIEMIRSVSADLVTVALRLANLYEFTLSIALVDRVKEKNNVNILHTG